jgi:hypothetical protein
MEPMTELDGAIAFFWAFVHSALFFVAAGFLALLAAGCAYLRWCLWKLEQPIPQPRRPDLRIVRRRRRVA